MLPYEDNVELNLKIDGLPISGNKLGDGVFLVVPYSSYNSIVSLLIGTNILVPLMGITRENSGKHFLQSAIKSAEQGPVTIEPNSDFTLKGNFDKEVLYHPVCCIMHSTKEAAIPDVVDITPTPVPNKYGMCTFNQYLYHSA